MTAWLLLFLAHGDGYGYGLAEQLREQALDVEMTVVYRVLRTLERDRLVTSRWIDSTSGPRRRLYSLTAAGRRTLDGLVAVVMEHRNRYCAFVYAFEHAARRDVVSPATTGSPLVNALSRRPAKELLIAWLLLLLDGDASYGYDLRQRLAERDVKADPGQLYRLLRRLDADGWLRSRWSDPILGPRRRVYRVTAEGRRNLRAIAELITRARDVHGAFAETYKLIDDDFRGPVLPQRGPRRRAPARLD